MKSNFAKAVSLILNPAIMPMLGIFIIFQSKVYYSINTQQQVYIYIIILFFSMLLPLSLFPLLTAWKLIENIHLDNRKDRFIPLVISTMSFYVAHFLIMKMGGPRLITLFTFSISLASLIVLIVTLFWKISLHMTGIGGVTALILSLTLTYATDLFYPLIIAVLLSGFLASIRLYLQVHNLLQIIAGYLTGFLCVFLTYYFFKV